MITSIQRIHRRSEAPTAHIAYDLVISHYREAGSAPATGREGKRQPEDTDYQKEREWRQVDRTCKANDKTSPPTFPIQQPALGPSEALQKRWQYFNVLGQGTARKPRSRMGSVPLWKVPPRFDVFNISHNITVELPGAWTCLPTRTW